MPITTAADDAFEYFPLSIFHRKLSLDISSESFAKLMIHINCQDIFCLEKFRMSSATNFAGCFKI